MAAPTGSSADLAEKLRTYGEQLAQVEQLLAQDPNNEQFKNCLLYTSPSPRDRG